MKNEIITSFITLIWFIVISFSLDDSDKKVIDLEKRVSILEKIMMVEAAKDG